MPIFDTHCHYNLEPLYSGQAFCFKIDENSPLLKKNWQDHWLEAQQNDIQKTLVPGAGLSSSKLAVEIAKKDQNLYASVAVHPLRVEKIELKKAMTIIEQLTKEKSVIAIGETGLDFFHFSKKDNLNKIQSIKQAQEQLFIEHIKLAIKKKKTLIIHARDQGEEGYWRILEILKEYWPAKENIIFHCLSGPIDYIKEAMNIKNSYFGFDGNLTFKNAKNLREMFQLIQKKKADKILLETDAPYLAPTPYRGQICQPKMISHLANFVKINLKANLDQIYQNSLAAFNLPSNSEKNND